MDIDAILASHVPSLVQEGFAQTSPASSDYNCIAWAAERTDEWWWRGVLQAVHLLAQLARCLVDHRVAGPDRDSVSMRSAIA